MNYEIVNSEDYTVLVEPRKRNRWVIIGIIIMSTALMIIYVYNVKRVDSLLSETRHLVEKYKDINTQNIILTSRINELESPERIIYIAEEGLGMVLPDEPPVFINNK